MVVMVPTLQMKLGRVSDLPKIPRAGEYGSRQLQSPCHSLAQVFCRWGIGGGGWRGTSLTLGSTQLNSTQLTAESTGASEALMIIFCAWYWAAFGKIDRKVTDEDV